MRYRVWNEDNGDREDAKWRGAWDHESAAREFAERDSDGISEGVYGGEGAALVVEDTDGNAKRFVVFVDYRPTFQAIERET